MELINKIVIDSEELAVLIEDERLKKEGYKIHYVVDAFDVLEYCFPKGIDLTKNINVDDFENNQMGYHYLFYEVNDINKPIILDEYLFEINRNRLRFISKHSNTDYLKDTFYDLVTKSKNYEGLKNTDIYTKLINDVHFLIASAIFNEDSISTFSDLMKNRVLYRKPDKFENKEAEEVFYAFNNTEENSSNALEAFNLWFNANSLMYIGKDPQYILQEFEATLRDFKAIERIINANRIMSLSQYPKNIFLYFSNSPRTEKIFKSEYFKNWYASNPILNDKDISIPLLRNIKDVVILFLLNIDTEKQKDSELQKNYVLQNLEQLHSLSLANDESKNEKELEWMKYFKDRQSLILANESITSKLLLNETYKNKAEAVLKEIEDKLNITERINLEKHFKKEFEEAKTANGYISELKSFKYLGTTISIQNKLSDFLNQVHSNSAGLINKGGKDYITGTFHKLPILLFHSEMYEGRKEDKFPFLVYDEVLTNLTKSDANKESENLKFIEKIKKILSYNHQYNKQEDFEGDYKLIMIFMMMLVLDDENLDENVLAYLTSIPEVLEKIYLNPELVDNKLKAKYIPFSKRKSYVEYLYFKAWIARRCVKYELSRKICLEALTEFPTDARFHHGLVLIDFCLYHENRKADIEITRDVKYLISLSEKAIELYEATTKEVSDSLIQGTIMSLQNMLSYLLVHDCFNKIISENKVDKNSILLEIKKIESLRELINQFSQGKYEPHFELQLTEHLISILKMLGEEDDNYKKILSLMKKDFKNFLDDAKKVPYLNFDYQIIELILKLE